MTIRIFHSIYEEKIMNKLPKNQRLLLVVITVVALLVGVTFYVTADGTPTGDTNPDMQALDNMPDMLSAPSVEQDQGTIGQPQLQIEVERWNRDPGGTPSPCNGSIKQTPNEPDECIEGYYPDANAVNSD